MKKQVILRIFVVILIIILGYESFSFAKILINPNEVLENVKTVDVFKEKSKALSIMVQDENMNWSEATDRTKWPSPTTHGYIGSKCTDGEGAEVPSADVISYNLTTNIATINTKNTLYCTLYFSKGKPALDMLQEKGGTYFAGGGQHTTAVDGLYRFNGTGDQVKNNYICFGTTDEEECKSKKDTYMYRILGITSEERTEDSGKKTMWQEGQLKIIKVNPAGSSKFDGSGLGYWSRSAAKSWLQNTFLSSISTSEPNGLYWSNLITEQYWYDEEQYPLTNAVKRSYVDSSPAKIGLIYASDYINAGNNNATNWLHLYHSIEDTGTYRTEWTMSLAMRNQSGTSRPYMIDIGCNRCMNGESGVVSMGSNAYGTATREMRPSFYLVNNVNLSGDGTSDHPYLIVTLPTS